MSRNRDHADRRCRRHTEAALGVLLVDRAAPLVPPGRLRPRSIARYVAHVELGVPVLALAASSRGRARKVRAQLARVEDERAADQVLDAAIDRIARGMLACLAM